MSKAQNGLLIVVHKADASKPLQVPVGERIGNRPAYVGFTNVALAADYTRDHKGLSLLYLSNDELPDNFRFAPIQDFAIDVEKMPDGWRGEVFSFAQLWPADPSQ